MVAFRDNANDGIDIYAHRVKTALFLGVLVVGACLSMAGVVWKPMAWPIWFFVVLFGLGAALFAHRVISRGVLLGRPAAVLTERGFTDRMTGIHVVWSDVDKIEADEQYIPPYVVMRRLRFTVEEPARAYASAGSVTRFLDRLGERASGPVNVRLTFLATTDAEILGLIRRFYDGRIEGHDEPLDTTPTRPPRRERFRRWVIPRAILALILVVVLALLLWLG